MAELDNLECPVCHRPLDRVPGRCGECGAFWSGRAQVEAELADQAAAAAAPPDTAPGETGGRPEAAGQDSWLDCGHQGTPGVPCQFCGQVTPRTAAPAAGTCLAVGGAVIALPEGVEVTLGRQSEWAQVADVFDSLTGAAVQGVSRRHATVTVLGRQVRIADLRSRNGTWIGNREVAAVPAVRDTPIRFQLGGLGVPEDGLTVEIRRPRVGEDVCEWTGERRD